MVPPSRLYIVLHQLKKKYNDSKKTVQQWLKSLDWGLSDRTYFVNIAVKNIFGDYNCSVVKVLTYIFSDSKMTVQQWLKNLD